MLVVCSEAETIEYLGREVKRDLSSKGTKKLGKPQGQFEKFALRDNRTELLLYAQPSRYLVGIGRRPELRNYSPRFMKPGTRAAESARIEYLETRGVLSRTHSNAEEEEFQEHLLVRIA